MSVNGYWASWRGRDYPASPDGALIRLYTDRPEPGFEPVGPDRYRRLMPAEEAEWFGYRRTVATLRGEPVVLLDERDDPAGARVLVEYLGDLPDGPPWWPPQRSEPGVYRAWVAAAELRDRTEQRLQAG
ncbi:hypothetical protein GCM10023322_39840 [Rugosimonospora acidiphila]|uniref:Uncharacterized protein n=1 Tax=Rugosimonospora acidiphila TaxID=556531 RepID=A0ABP9RZ06_9ACTN